MRFCEIHGRRLQKLYMEKASVVLRYKVEVEVVVLSGAGFLHLNSSSLSMPQFPHPWNGNEESVMLTRVTHEATEARPGTQQYSMLTVLTLFSWRSVCVSSPLLDWEDLQHVLLIFLVTWILWNAWARGGTGVLFPFPFFLSPIWLVTTIENDVEVSRRVWLEHA